MTLAAGAAHAQPEGAMPLQVEHAAARLVVIAEPRSDIAVSVQHGPSRLPELTLRRDGGRLILDGGLGRPFGGDRVRCVGGLSLTLFGGGSGHRADTRAVLVEGVGRVPFADLPVVTAHVPLDARLATSGAVFGQIGQTRSLALSPAGCGDWTAGHVRERCRSTAPAPATPASMARARCTPISRGRATWRWAP